MGDLNESADLDKESVAQITLQSACIALFKGSSRNIIQKTLSLNPIQIFSNNKATKKSTTTENSNCSIINKDNLRLKENKIAGQVNLNNALEKQALYEKFLNCLISESKKLFSDPLAYLADKTNFTINLGIELISKVYNSFKKIPSIIANTFKESLEFIFEFFKPASRDVPSYSQTSSRIKNEVNTDRQKEDKSTCKQEKIECQPSTVYKIFSDLFNNDEFSLKKPKAALVLLINCLKQIAEAINKSRQIKETDQTSMDLIKEEIKTDAKVNLDKAEHLRPDLAKYLELPTVDFVLVSPFNKAPSVASLIEKAEKEAKKSEMH